jgi:hypothetical protein
VTAEELAAIIRRPVAMFRRRDWDYHTSHPMQELQVELTDGSTFDLLFKDLDATVSSTKRGGRGRAFLYNPRRRSTFTATCSRACSLTRRRSTAQSSTSAAIPNATGCFIECVGGIPLWQCELTCGRRGAVA